MVAPLTAFPQAAVLQEVEWKLHPVKKLVTVQILMNWSQEELEQWTVTQQQKDEDTEAIERYAAQDRAKIKELDLAITRMNRTVAAHKGDLQREVTDTQSVQMQLRKAADDFESLHKASALYTVRGFDHQACTMSYPGQSTNIIVQERQDLIQQWEDAIAQMRRTDAAIQTASELFADSKMALREKQQRLDIAAQFLDDQISNNKDCEGQIETLERDLARLRTEFTSRQVCVLDYSKCACSSLHWLTAQMNERDHALCSQLYGFTQ
jgi:coiled-coil domain-containing protein 39